MKQLKYYVFVLFLTAIWWKPALAATIIDTPVVTQSSSDSVVVIWKTNLPASSQVKYSAPQLFSELLTPDYPAKLVQHEVKINGLISGIDYEFVAISTDENAQTTQSDPVVFRLSPQSDDQAPTGISASPNTLLPKTKFNVRESISSFFTGVQQKRISLISILTEAKQATTIQKSSLGFAIIGALLTFLILLIEETSLVFVLDWIFVFFSFRLFKKRHHKHRFKIIDGLTDKPVRNAEVAIIDPINNTVIRTYNSDENGNVRFDWSVDRAVSVRVTRRGYQAASAVFENDLFDIMLTPLQQVVDNSSLVMSKIKFQLKHSLVTLNIICLSLGSLLVLVMLFGRITSLDILLLLVYGYVWFLFLVRKPKRYHMAQVVDAANQDPLPFTHVTMYRKNKAEHAMTDKNGYVPVAYPIPELISLSRKGFVSVLRQTVPAASVGSDPIILVMKPKV